MSESAGKTRFDLTGRVALVTGGGRGVGRATASLLAEAGAAVAVGYRSRGAEAERTVDELSAAGARALAVEADLCREGSGEALVRRVLEHFERLDFLVVNHGVWPAEEVPLAEMTRERWSHTVGTNLEGAVGVLRAAIPHLREGGAIVLVSSTAGQRGEAFHADYAASKAALHALAKSLCVELAPREIRVNAVAPGWIDTEMAEPAFRDGGLERIRKGIPLDRVARPDDVAGPILFLCSSFARHVTGEVLNVNGGAVLYG